MKRRTGQRAAVLLVATATLAGCAGLPVPEVATRFAASPGPEAPATTPAAPGIVEALSARSGGFVPGSSYDRIAAAALSSGAQVEAAELEAARLRQTAAGRNWLPTIGPTVSLTSLGDLAADLVVNQVLFDNGRKRAERDLARAEVDAAAVRLVESADQRVARAIGLYLDAEEGRQAAAHFERAHKDMAHFEWIMSERVAGGVSNPSDLTVLRQKLARIAADRDRARDSAIEAKAQFERLAPDAAPDGIGALSGATASAPPVAVLAARAKKARVAAEAEIARSGFLPGLSAELSARSGQGGLSAAIPNGLGLGTGASLKAGKADITAAEERIIAAQEDHGLEVARLTSEIEATRRQLSEAEGLAQQAKGNLDLFQRQYEGGQRRVMEVVGVYETWSDAMSQAITLKYALARAELRLAALQGGLAAGDRV
ncbi:TolC family protein [Roseivivax sp. THAF30]|uniref:TolC family protein n=1 Tax=Roseivivax sp. THAF30 TaxID=2587852 RepID=UPI0012692571|nr:TolC family protein [Roseivivax sp. THAF30]QFT64557.1 Outer membrane efflux protein [Roseivivax sp. THAF30]